MKITKSRLRKIIAEEVAAKEREGSILFEDIRSYLPGPSRKGKFKVPPGPDSIVALREELEELLGSELFMDELLNLIDQRALHDALKEMWARFGQSAWPQDEHTLEEITSEVLDEDESLAEMAVQFIDEEEEMKDPDPSWISQLKAEIAKKSGATGAEGIDNPSNPMYQRVRGAFTLGKTPEEAVEIVMVEEETGENEEEDIFVIEDPNPGPLKEMSSKIDEENFESQDKMRDKKRLPRFLPYSEKELENMSDEDLQSILMFGKKMKEK